MSEPVTPVNVAAAEAARLRLDALTKPLRSLGRLEALAIRLSAIAGDLPQGGYPRRTILIGAADHGVVAEGVSAYPPAVTAQMVGGFLAGHAAINALARAAGAQVVVVDFGVATPSAGGPRFLDLAVGRGTRNLAREPALGDDVDAVLAAGERAFAALADLAPCDALALGDMGIGNTTCAAAMIAAFTGAAPDQVVGAGTGIDAAGRARKADAIARGLARCADGTWPTIARELGGYEIVGLAGTILAAGRARIPILLDGVALGAAALLACAIEPAALGYCIAAHRSREPAHALALAALGLIPLLDLDLALGEASGAALAFPLLEAAARMICEMRTFEEAGVATALDRSAPS